MTAYGQEAPQGIVEHINPLGQKVSVVTAAQYQLTTPASTWPVLEEVETTWDNVREIRNKRARREDVNPAALPVGEDPLLQRNEAIHEARSTIVSILGQSGSGNPPDPTGSAGPDHYVQAVNTAVRVYNKSGAAVAGPFSLSSYWAGSTNAGDPIVLYDRHADRWFISQFQFQPNRMLLAVSATPDPTGAYHTYSFNFSQFPDYPKFSVWWDGYYMTSNSNATTVVFERSAMLAGAANARMVSLNAPNLGTAGFRSVLPADADGDLPPAGTPCYFFNLEDDAWSGVSQDRIKIYRMTTDWNTPANTTVTTHQTLPTEPFSTNFGFGFNNITQPGTTQRLDAVSQIFYFRAQHTRWPDHNAVVLCNVVNIGNQRAGIRWYELRDANDGNWSIFQQGTWAPDNANRWMASIAMDMQGNIGLGYSFTDPDNDVRPGLRFTGRLANDPPGQMTFEESVVLNGTGVQSGGNRYGDYSHMSLDPDGSTFWFTGEYLANQGQRTRIFSFDLSGAAGIADGGGASAARMSAHLDADGLVVNASGLPTGTDLFMDLIDLQGRRLLVRPLRSPDGTWQHKEALPTLASGVYFVRIGGGDFQRVQRILIERP